MTEDSGQAGVRNRMAEVTEYLAAVRAELADLSPSEQDDLLEDLAIHLTEVAAEDPAPLADRLGPPTAYAAELRAAAGPAVPSRHQPGTARLADWWARTLGRLRRLDLRVGPLIGYERASEFGRLLVPAWWAVRGYLAAMVVVSVLDQPGQIGLLPRLGGSTLAGLLILAGAVAGSIWLAHRTPGLERWQRRTVHTVSGFLVLFGLAGFLSIDGNQRSGWTSVPEFVSVDPYENVQDVFVVDQNGELLTGVSLLDQNGNPLDIGWVRCEEEFEEFDESDRRFVTYPRCPRDAPPWLTAVPSAPSSAPSPAPSPSLAPSPSPAPTAVPVPSAEPVPSGEPSSAPSASG